MDACVLWASTKTRALSYGGRALPEIREEGLPRGEGPKKDHSPSDEEPTRPHRPAGPSPGSKHKVLLRTENEREKSK
jgi:hypothetical protein